LTKQDKCEMDPGFPSLRRRTDLIRKDLRGQMYLYDRRVETVHILNPTAGLVWDLCTGGHTPADMEAALRRRFRVGPQHDVPADVQRVLLTFAERGLLESE